MMLAAAKGTEIRIDARGEDADEAVASLCELIAARFGEDE